MLIQAIPCFGDACATPVWGEGAGGDYPFQSLLAAAFAEAAVLYWPAPHAAR
jgi:hypothetical protein